LVMRNTCRLHYPRYLGWQDSLRQLAQLVEI
jgi:hypothetical protein